MTCIQFQVTSESIKMNSINEFLLEFGDIIFDEHLSFISAFKNDYENFNESLPCRHNNSNEDVVGICRCYFFQMKKRRVMKIIKKYKDLMHRFSTIAISPKEEREGWL